MEKLDLYNSNRRPLNKIIERDTVKLKGEYSLAVGVFIVDSKGRLLITLRCATKEFYSNLWENTAGAVVSGESSLQGAVREVYEETGLVTEKSDFVLLEEVRENSAFFSIYFLRKDFTLDDIVLQKGETVDKKLVTFPEFEEMIDNNLVAKPVANRYKSMKFKLAKLNKV